MNETSTRRRFARLLASLAGATLFALGAAACGLSAGDFEEALHAAAACKEGDTCVIYGPTDCTCSVAVNESKLAELKEQQKDLDCGDVFVDCIDVTNPRCEGGKCVLDQVQF